MYRDLKHTGSVGLRSEMRPVLTKTFQRPGYCREDLYDRAHPTLAWSFLSDVLSDIKYVVACIQGRS